MIAHLTRYIPLVNMVKSGFLPGIAACMLMIPSTAYAVAVDITESQPTVPAQPTITVQLQGLLLDVNGNPVNEGFLMLKGNPQLSALSDARGQFRMEGRAWEMPDILLASSAGCEVSQTHIDLPVTAGIRIQLKRQDPVFSRLEMGADLQTGWMYGAARSLTEPEKLCIQSFNEFIKSRGNAIIDKILAGKPLGIDEEPYEEILAAQIRIRNPITVFFTEHDPNPDMRYCAHLMQSFYRVSIKALRRERLTNEDVHALRLASAMYRGTGFDLCGNEYVHGLGEANRERGVSYPGMVYPAVTPGDPLPGDVALLLSSPLLKSPGWTDLTSLSAGFYLRLEGLWPLLDSYWKWQIQGEKTLLMSPVGEWKKHYWQDWYQVTSLNGLAKKGGGRPVYLNSVCFIDCNEGFWVRQAEALRNAYPGSVDVYQVSNTAGLAQSDVFLDEQCYFGVNPKRDPLAGLDCPRLEDQNYTPVRHARIDKLTSMEFPWTSGEILLDLPRMVSFLWNCIGIDQQVILDRDGRVANPFPAGSASWDIPGRMFPDLATYHTYSHQSGTFYWGSLIYEQVIRELIAHEGRFSKAGTGGMGTFDHVLVQFPNLFTAKDDVFIVTSVDQAHHLVHAGWVDPGGFEVRKGGNYGFPHPVLFGGTPKGDFLFRLKPDTRFEVRMKNGKPTWFNAESSGDPEGAEYRLGGIGDFKPGDRFFITFRFAEPVTPDLTLAELEKRGMDPYFTSPDEVKREHRPAAFDMAKYDGRELPIERITNYTAFNNYAGSNEKYMPLFGTIVKKQDDIITVKIDQEKIKEMWGYRFWKEEEAKGLTPETMPGPRPPDLSAPKFFWPPIKRWGDGTEQDRTYRFQVDGSTDVYRNGLVAEAKDLAVGDHVFVEYEIWWERQKQYAQVIPPERVQASAPLEAATTKPDAR